MSYFQKQGSIVWFSTLASCANNGGSNPPLAIKMDALIKNKIKSLSIKGFDKNEISKILDIGIKEIKLEAKVTDMAQESEIFYSELQKDLSSLVLTEMSNPKRDSGVILNAIKLQADLQEKKLVIHKKIKITKINKDYIYQRDEEIANLNKLKIPKEEIAKRFKVSILSIDQALDRCSLNLSDELKTLSPTIITETIKLPKKMRMKILDDAYRNNYTRKDIREMVNKIKNDTR